MHFVFLRSESSSRSFQTEKLTSPFLAVTFVVLSTLATLLLIYPAYYSPNSTKHISKLNNNKKRVLAPGETKKPVRVRSAAQLVIRLLHIKDKESEGGKERLQNDGKMKIEETSDERTLKWASISSDFLRFNPVLTDDLLRQDRRVVRHLDVLVW